MLELTPALVMSVWTAGIAAGAAAVAYWNIVGPGYVWLAGGTVALLGVFAGVVDAGLLAWVGVAAALGAAALARRSRLAAAALASSAVCFVLIAVNASPWLPALTGAVLIGGITSEMLLGHWYLVDPTLPRWALRALVVAGGAGLLLDVGIIGLRVASGGVRSDAVFGWAYVALVVMTLLLVIGVWFSLNEPRYTGVMAATGLSYLAVLTGLGVVVIGRIVGFDV